MTISERTSRPAVATAGRTRWIAPPTRSGLARAVGLGVALALVAGCSSGGESTASDSTPPTAAPAETEPAPESAPDPAPDLETTPTNPGAAPTDAPTSDVPDTSGPPTNSTPPEPAETSAPVAPESSADCPPTTPATAPDGESTTLEEVGTFDGGTVYAAEYAVPDDLGAPWSQWGQGLVLPDGRFVSGVGDHRGADGRSWFYEYDPTSRTLVRTTEVGPALGHQPGDWGYGKIHAPMVLDVCDRVVTATYWGSRRGLELGGSYSGDHLIRYDPSTREVTSLGVPVEGFGLPSLSMSPDRSTLYVEAVDPESEPDAGVFVVADPLTGEVLHTDESADHVGFRDVLVTPNGAGLYAAGNGLAGLSPSGEEVSEGNTFGSEAWFRTASTPAADGSVAISTRKPDALWIRDGDGAFRDLGAVEAYVASLALTSDGATAYFVPGAHGDGAEFGTPLVAADTQTGAQEVVVRLNDLIEPALDIQVGGTYNVVVDDANRRVYVGLNGGPPGSEEVFGDVVLAVVEFD